MPTDNKPIDVLSEDTLMILYTALNRAHLQIHPKRLSDSEATAALIAIRDAKKKLDEINDRNEKRV
jgi:hypothetical protein